MKTQKTTCNMKCNFVWILTILMFSVLLASVASAETTWYVKANAGAGGDGSESRPFNSLAAVEAASGPGDTIIVLDCPADIDPLDGGIALKDGQKLEGTGPDVTLAAPQAARLTNSNADRYDGDAIVLANDNEVTNVHVIDAYRSAISGYNITGADIHHNLVTGHNQGREIFVHIDPTGYNVYSEYGGIHLTADADNVMGDLLVHHNVVRNARGVGVLLYLNASASAQLLLDGNTVTDLLAKPNGENAAIVMATIDSAIGNVIIRDTSVDNIGSDSIWTDGALFYMEGSSQQDVLIQGFTYRNTKDVGGGQSFGMCAGWIIRTADNARFNFRLEDSELRGMKGWCGVVLFVEGSNSDITWHIENTVVENSGRDGIDICNLGPGNDYEIHLEGNQVRDCRGDGFLFINDSSIENVEISLKDNAYLGNRDIPHIPVPIVGGCYFGPSSGQLGGPIGDFRVMMEGNDLVGGGYGIKIKDPNALIASSIIDLGGGGLGSAGRNRIFDNTNAVHSINHDVVAKNNWWGSPEGPSSSLLEGSATFDFEPFLTEDPGPSEKETSVKPTRSLKTMTWGRLKEKH